MRNWFQAFAFKWVDLCRSSTDGEESRRILERGGELRTVGGGCTRSIQFTHSARNSLVLVSTLGACQLSNLVFTKFANFEWGDLRATLNPKP